MENAAKVFLSQRNEEMAHYYFSKHYYLEPSALNSKWLGILSLWKKENNKAISKNVSHVLTYELAAWGVAYAISISSHDAVMVKYWDDLEAYGYEESFIRNIGISLEEFYSEFGVFRGKTIGGQMDIIAQQINY